MGAPAAYVVVTVALVVALALWCDARRHVHALRRDNRRLAARLATFTSILAGLPAAVRADRAVRISREELAVLALLIELEGPDGDELAALERMLARTPDRDPGHQE